MEWVVTSAATAGEATERALDALGVAADDAEVEVLAEPQGAGWGRQTQARVRARVRPSGPPPRLGENGRDQRRGRSRLARGRNRSNRRRSGRRPQRGNS